MGVQITACGAYVPEECVRNEDLSKLGYDADWIVQRTGIQQRHRAAPGEATSDLAYRASVRCLERAGVRADEVDLILVATMTPDTPMPSTACHLQRRLCCAAAAIDVNAACAGFLYALATAAHFVYGGSCRRVLVVGADVMTRVVNPEDKKTYPLFGDGAGAVLVEAGSKTQGLLAFTLGADGEGTELLCMPGGGSRLPLSRDVLARQEHFVRMNGRPVFKWAVRILAHTILDVLDHATLGPSDIDTIVFHQANKRIIDAAVEAARLDPEKVVLNLDRFGNTSAGSVPLALDEALAAGRIRRGDHVLLCGFGGGLAWGAALIKW